MNAAQHEVRRDKGDEDLCLGRVYLPATGMPVGKFEFLVDTGSGGSVEIGTPVTALTAEGKVVGTVIDLRVVGHDQNPLAADYGSQYDADTIARSSSVLVAQVQVFWAPSMRPVQAGIVRPASPAELELATGQHEMKWKIPAGVVPLVGGGFGKICLDGHFLLGPEGAHTMIGGTAGLAAKTSYAGLLLRSALANGSEREAVGALVFNVKGEDLLWLDEAPVGEYELTDADLAMYAALGIPAEPFDDVTVYAPGMPAGGRGTRSTRPDAVRLAWDLPTVWPYLRYFFGSMDWFGDQILQAFLAEFAEFKLHARNPTERIDTFGKLEEWFDARIAEASGGGEAGLEASQTAWRSHHIASFRRFRRMLGSLPARGGGLITRESSSSSEDIPIHGWHHGQVVVVDIAGLSTDIQGVVIARTIERVLQAAESGELGVPHLVLAFDELNSFAPATGSEMSQVRRILERVATQGRYAGVSLLAAGQQLSKCSEQIIANATSRALGRSADLELSSSVYGRLPTGLAERIATMPKGSMALWHYSLRAPTVIKFPRPAWRTGRAPGSGGDSAKRPRTTDGLGLRQESLSRLSEGLAPEHVESVVNAASTAEEARVALERARIPDMRKVVVHEPSTADPTDPFALDD